MQHFNTATISDTTKKVVSFAGKASISGIICGIVGGTTLFLMTFIMIISSMGISYVYHQFNPPALSETMIENTCRAYQAAKMEKQYKETLLNKTQ